MRVLICPDKFKGSLTAPEAAEAMARGWTASRPGDQLELFPISDGGDGFGQILGTHLGAEERYTETVDAAHRPVRASWWWLPESRIAIVESARIIGLAMLPRGKFHPFDLDTFGLGQVLADVAHHSPDRCIVGIGGSATNDGGFGMARALGWRFMGASDREITRWVELGSLQRVIPPTRRLRLSRLQVAVDVRNRLLGKEGATRVYGPQKGLTPDDFPIAERALRKLAMRTGKRGSGPRNLATEPGTGAAGGLGFGLRAFAGARIVPGFSLFSRQTRFSDRLKRAEFILTGEGAVDLTTTRMGKGVGLVVNECRRSGKDFAILAGKCEGLDEGALRSHIHVIAPDLASPSSAMRRASHWLGMLARKVAKSVM